MKYSQLELKMILELEKLPTDKDTMKLSKDNCLALMSGLKITPVKLPKPQLPICMNYVHTLSGKAEDVDDINYQYEAAMYYILNLCRTHAYDELAVAVSNLGYYLACNNVRVSVSDKEAINSILDYIYHCLNYNNRIDLKYMVRDFDKLFEYSIVERKALKGGTPIVDYGIPMYDNEPELPIELLEHLAKFGSLESVVLEACRIMMLGPKYKRADDAVSALVSAFEVMPKDNDPEV